MTTEIQEYSQTEAALAVLSDRYKDATYDVTKADGMKEAKEARAEVRGYRTSLENMRKDIKAPALERCRLIDSEAKRITAELLKLEKPIDEQIKEQEKKVEARRQAKIRAEERRVEKIQERIENIRGIAINSDFTISSEDIGARIADLEKLEINEEQFEEFLQQAKDAKHATLARLRENEMLAKNREAEEMRIAEERAELEKLRAEQAMREQKEREEREKAEAEERAKREAEEEKRRKELAAVAEKQAAEQKRLDEEKAKLEEEKKEREAKERAEAEARAKAEEAARKAKYPGEAAIIGVLILHFGVTEEVAKRWLDELIEERMLSEA